MSASIARVRFDVYGGSASEVSDGLLDAAAQIEHSGCAGEVSYGETVIERCLDVQDGHDLSWKGRLSLFPALGCEPFVPVTNLRKALA